LITDRLFEGLPMAAVTSVEEIHERLKPYRDSGATRIILPYVAQSKDVVGELRGFITAWGKAASKTY
jgi:hypothetical protein